MSCTAGRKGAVGKSTRPQRGHSTNQASLRLNNSPRVQRKRTQTNETETRKPSSALLLTLLLSESQLLRFGFDQKAQLCFPVPLQPLEPHPKQGWPLIKDNHALIYLPEHANDTVLGVGPLPKSKQCQHLQTSNRKLNNCPAGNMNQFTVVKPESSKTLASCMRTKQQEHLRKEMGRNSS